ncbi:MAG: tetratricopeptide repeat protein [Coleofasciculaceae cyanobacterium SM2_3_26]|nr:tetratricopeptide repeat protein [Coleofasciculaceae cyanobacterium SM2_3_26]
MPACPPAHFALYARLHFTRAAIALQPSTQDSNIDRWLTDTAELAEALGDRTASAYALGYLGEIHEQRQQWQQAETLTQKALQAASAFTEAEHDATPAAIASLLNIDLTYQWQWQLGRVLAAQGEYERAIASYSNAFDLLQKLRSDLAVTTSESQFAFRDTVEPFYRQYLSLLLPPENSAFLKADDTSSQARLERSRQVVESLQLAELDNFFRMPVWRAIAPLPPGEGSGRKTLLLPCCM